MVLAAAARSDLSWGHPIGFDLGQGMDPTEVL